MLSFFVFFHVKKKYLYIFINFNAVLIPGFVQSVLLVSRGSSSLKLHLSNVVVIVMNDHASKLCKDNEEGWHQGI